jgi:hypothetical protein
MAIDFKKPEDFLEKTGLVFHTALAIPLLPFVILFLEIKNRAYQGQIELGFLALMISYGVPLISGLLVAWGFQIMKNESIRAREKQDLKGKLEAIYLGASKFYWLVGIACFLLSVALWFTAYGVLIVAYVIILFFMSLNRPTPKRFVKALVLEGKEKEIMLNEKEHQF